MPAQGKVNAGESWLQHLKTQEYDELSFEQRVNILWTLVNLALDGPAVRAALEARTEEAQRIRKQMWEEAKVSPCKPMFSPLPEMWFGALTLCLPALWCVDNQSS